MIPLASGLSYLLFPLLVILAAGRDLTAYALPNWLNAALLAGFMLAAAAAGLSAGTWAAHGGVALLVLVTGFILFLPGWIGGGDAKFAACLTLWIGPDEALEFLVLAAVLGGLLTLAILALRRQVLPHRLMRIGWLARLHDPDQGVPYGLALAGGALLVFPQTDLFQRLSTHILTGLPH